MTPYIITSMQEYRQSQKEKWEKERSSPQAQRKESSRSKSPSSKLKMQEKDDKDKHRPPSSSKTQNTTPPTTAKSKSSSTSNSKINELSKSTQKNTKIQQGEHLIHETLKTWKTSYLYSIKHLETQSEIERYPEAVLGGGGVRGMGCGGMGWNGDGGEACVDLRGCCGLYGMGRASGISGVVVGLHGETRDSRQIF